MNFSHIQLPKEVAWADNLSDVFATCLINPLQSFLNNSGKNIRPKLVELGLRLSLPQDNEALVQSKQEQITIASSIIEAIHAGSLIIDDIQDESEVRRDLPTMHLQHGLPVALNAGNWLYFWALEQLKHLKLSPEKGQILFFEILNLMTRAHYGQALDVGVRVDQIEQQRVHDLALTSMKLKTGALFSIAFLLGAGLNSEAKATGNLAEFSEQFGVALQAYDDVGNFLKPQIDAPSKRHEDLRLRRPSWVWAQASLLPPSAYEHFKSAVSNLPDEKELNEWIKQHDFRSELIRGVTHLLNRSKVESHLRWADSHKQSQKIIHDICQQLEKAYVHQASGRHW